MSGRWEEELRKIKKKQNKPPNQPSTSAVDFPLLAKNPKQNTKHKHKKKPKNEPLNQRDSVQPKRQNFA